MKAQLPILLLLLFGSTSAPAQEAFENGVTAYEEKNYESAEGHFLEAIRKEESAAARHNLALVRARLDQPADALWQLERAVRLEPFNTTYETKRQALRRELGLPPKAPDWFTRTARALTPNTWIAAATLGFWTFLALLLIPRAAGIRAGIGVRTLRVLTLLLCLLSPPPVAHYLQNRGKGLVVASEPVPLHIAPAGSSPRTAEVPPGSEAEIRDRHNNFLRIETGRNRAGWIHAKHFRPFAPATPEKTGPAPIAPELAPEESGGGTN